MKNPTISVLYVDDEPGLLDLGKIFLEKGGQFNVDIIEDVPKALDLVKNKDYDAIISDYQMPGIDGIQFLQMIRTSGNTIPFILFTGRGREEVVIQALNEGADFYIQKGGDTAAQFAELHHQIRQAVQRRRAELSVKDLERREADIINFLPDATFAIDRCGRIITWNHAIEKMSGVPALEMLGKGDYEYALPFYGERQPILIDLIFESDDVIARRYPHIIRNGDALIGETTVARPKCGVVTLTGKASPLYNCNGEIIGAIESIRDITDRKQAEDALRESENNYRALVENVIDVIYRTDPDGTLLFATPSILSLLGYGTMDEIIGRPKALMWANPEKHNEMLAKIAKDGFVKNYEIILKRKDGTPVCISTSSHFYRDNKGTIQGIEGIFRDITQFKQIQRVLRQSEELYRVLVLHIQDGAFLMQDGILLMCNEAFAGRIGFQPGEIIGTPVTGLIAPEDCAKVLKQQQNFLAGMQLQETYEFRMLHKNGKDRVLVSLSFGTAVYQNRPAIVGTVREIV